MILFPRPAATIRLDRGPLQVALRKPPAIFRPSHRTARDASKASNSTAEPSRGNEGVSGAARGLPGLWEDGQATAAPD